MIDENKRILIYNTAFKFMIENNMSTIPVCPEELCKKQGIELVSLTQIVTGTGLNQDEVFAIWGNEDGVIQSLNGKYKISYNDTKPAARIRFTLLEELSHALLNHCSDPGFNMFNQQYDSLAYERYEEEARACAGLILCPPQFYYSFPYVIPQSLFQKLYDVSKPCAHTRIDILNKYENEIKECQLYEYLPLVDYEDPNQKSFLELHNYQFGSRAVIRSKRQHELSEPIKTI